MGFDVKSDKGLKEFNAHLEDKSYVNGYVEYISTNIHFFQRIWKDFSGFYPDFHIDFSKNYSYILYNKLK